MNLNVLLVFDEPEISKTLSAILGAWKKHQIEVETSGYDLGSSGAIRQWLDGGIDLFIIGLERHYEWGRRPEGILLAKELAQRGKAVLIVSSDVHPISGVGCYWDISSDLRIHEAVVRAIDQQVVSGAGPWHEDLETMRRFFEPRLRRTSHHSALPIPHVAALRTAA